METGLAALQQTINNSKRKGGGNGSRVGYISWKDQETKVLRFLTNEVISAQVAEWVITHDGKSQDFMVDSVKGNFVQKYGGMSKNRQTGQLEEPKLKPKGIAIAVIRKEEPLGGGRTQIVDAFESQTANGTNFQGRTFGIVKQGIKNFWKPLLAMASNYEGLCDRDYAITRDGDNVDTIYLPRPIEPTADTDQLRDINILQQYYGYGRPWDDNDPERFLFCPQTLEEWADYYSGEERAKFWLAPKQGAAVPSSFGAPGQFAGYTTITAPPPQQQAPSFVQPSAPPFQPTPPAQQTPGPWGSNEDEAQAVPSGNTNWADLQSKLMPQIQQASVEAQQTAPVSP